MDTILILDSSIFLLLTILANLSRRIGYALEIPPYYRGFYIGAGFLALLMAVEILVPVFTSPTHFSQDLLAITLCIRAIIVLTVLPLCFIYWKWLFAENLKK